MTPEEKKEAKRLYDIEYRKKNRERIQELKKEWYENNPEKVKESTERNKEGKKIADKKYAAKNKNKLNEKKKQWALANKEKVTKAKTKHFLKKIKEDPLFKLRYSISGAIRQSFKRKGYTKNSKSAEILTCTFEELKQSIESKFEPWMTWENYGLYNGELNHGWDIDHIVPLSTAICEADIIKLNHFNNLQPLCSKINRDIKRNNPSYY